MQPKISTYNTCDDFFISYTKDFQTFPILDASEKNLRFSDIQL